MCRGLAVAALTALAACAVDSSYAGIKGNVSFTVPPPVGLSTVVARSDLIVRIEHNLLPAELMGKLTSAVEAEIARLGWFAAVDVSCVASKEPLCSVDGKPCLHLVVRLVDHAVVTGWDRFWFGQQVEPTIEAVVDLRDRRDADTVLARGLVRAFSQTTGVSGDTTERLIPAFASSLGRFLCGRSGF